MAEAEHILHCVFNRHIEQNYASNEAEKETKCVKTVIGLLYVPKMYKGNKFRLEWEP